MPMVMSRRKKKNHRFCGVHSRVDITVSMMTLTTGVERMKKPNLLALAKQYELVVKTWSPGDGVTRYRFVFGPEKSGMDYFSSDHIYTALGLKEASTFLRGWMAAKNNQTTGS